MNIFFNKRKESRIPALMIVSQFVLTIFVVYWLSGQYNQEKKTLNEQLFSEYTGAIDQLIDSVLVEHLINPILNDSLTYSLKIDTDKHNISTDENISDKIITKNYNLDSVKSKKIIAIDLKNISDSATIMIDSSNFILKNQNEVLKRSVKLMINHSDNSYNSIGKFIYQSPLDTILFKKIFSKRISNHYFDFKLNWDNDDSQNVKNSGIYLNINPQNGKDSLKITNSNFSFNTESPNKLPGVYVNDYTLYIISLVFPQFIFAVFLIGLSASAFFFTYLSLKKQTQLNTLRNDFISNITHELKTPVSTAKVALEALRNYDMKDDPKVANEYLNMVSIEMNRLDGLIAKVLDHSILEYQKDIIVTEKIDLNSLVNITINSMKPQFSKYKAQINFEPNSQLCLVDIDRLYIEGVIINLLDNSLKYAIDIPDISVSIKNDANFVFLTVSDKGPGIPKEYLSKLFEKFFRIPTGNKHNVKGYGLGLSFASLVMKQHNGEIIAENQPNGGCLFSLKFPISKQ